MSVVPDLLLKPAAAEARPKASSQAGAPAAAPQRAKDSSFSKVYERERQATSSEPAPARGEPQPGRKPAHASSDSVNETSPSEPSVVAADGNVLPADPAQTPVDPLLLLGLGLGEKGEAEAEAAAEADAEAGQDAADLPLIPGAAAVSLVSAPVTVDAARLDPQTEKLNSAAAVELTLQLDASAKRSAAQSNDAKMQTGSFASEEEIAAVESEADSLLSSTSSTAQENSEQLEVLVRSAAPETLKEVPAESRGEAFFGRLNALAQQMNPQLSVPRAVPMVPGQPVPMQQGGWSEAVVDRVMWLSSQNLKSAEIQLDPAELGRLEVRISMNQDLAQVTFASANPNVRDALESQMSRLRELFAQQGMNQLDVNVSDQSLTRGWQGQGDERQARGGAAGVEGTVEEELAAGAVEGGVSTIRVDRGLVDYYA